MIFVILWENDPERRLTLDAKEELEESDSSSLYKLLYLCSWIDICVLQDAAPAVMVLDCLRKLSYPFNLFLRIKYQRYALWFKAPGAEKWSDVPHRL